MRIIAIFFLILISSCTKSKSVLICGDHVCINKAEAKKYFEENLEIEVKIVSENKETRYDLVQMNINNDKEIKVFKNKNNKPVKKLTKNEVKLKKKEIREYNKITKFKSKKSDNKVKQNDSVKLNKNKPMPVNPKDICLKLEKCNIDTITSYLIKNSNYKDYPDITTKE